MGQVKQILGMIMPAVGALLLIIETLFAVHAIKTGRGCGWVAIILMFPAIGCLVYLICEILPASGNGPLARRIAGRVTRDLDPARELRRRTHNLELADSVENRANLAEECISNGLYDEAIILYEAAATGLFCNDPKLLLGLAHAHFFNREYHQTRETLERLVAANPEFRSPQGRLLYARSLEGAEDMERALHEYEVLAQNFPGAEAKCRQAFLLKKLGRFDEAQKLFQDVVSNAGRAPKHYRTSQRQWIDSARAQLV